MLSGDTNFIVCTDVNTFSATDAYHSHKNSVWMPADVLFFADFDVPPGTTNLILRLYFVVTF